MPKPTDAEIDALAIAWWDLKGRHMFKREWQGLNRVQRAATIRQSKVAPTTVIKHAPTPDLPSGILLGLEFHLLSLPEMARVREAYVTKVWQPQVADSLPDVDDDAADKAAAAGGTTIEIPKGGAYWTGKE